jgi:Leucine-rich repeat (LRR) protein
MSSINPLTFPDFANATNFCRWIGCGVVLPCPGRAGYVWHSEGTPLDEGQQSRYDAYTGVDSVWHDDESGLTWLYSPTYVSLHPMIGYRDAVPEPLFAGFSDWRKPTLTELKSLRSDLQDKNGLWRTPALAGKTGSVQRSVTNGYFDRNECKDWDFARDCACEDEHRDSKIAWGSEGKFAGFEGGSSRHTGAKSIFVRGNYSAQRPEWLEAQVQWAEKHRVDDFPVTEKTIGLLTELMVWGSNFPPYLDHISGLRSLGVRSSATLEPTVFALPALESLTWTIERHEDAAKQEISLPSEVGDLKQLRKLSVRGPIELFPDSICDLGNLEELDLGWAVAGLPPALGDLKQLRKLSVRGPIELFPDSICDLENLEELDLGCAVAGLPPALGRLSNLCRLRVSGDRMNSLPPSIGQLLALVEFCVHAKDLRRLPQELGLLQSLVLLDMSRCTLQHLPAQLAELRSLKVLSLELNQLSEVPEVVCRLPQLEKLNLSFNPLTALPSELGALKSLKSLDLRGAPIVEVPVAVRELTNLETLNLSGTQIQELPQWLWEMKSLRCLAIGSTWRLPRRRKQEHPTIKVIDFDLALHQPWGREWLHKMGKPD